jgi:urease accessory protein
VRAFLILCVLVIAAPAFAHPGHMPQGGIAEGFAHPFSGWDHLLAMVAIGLWLGLTQPGKPLAAFAVFCAALAAGFILGNGGVAIPLVEPSILSSMLVFGVLTAMAVKLPVRIAAPVIAAFTVFHGYAHGAEAPADAAMPFAAGFILASIMIVGMACSTAQLLRRMQRSMIVRQAGAAIAAAGAVFALAG